MWSSRAWSTLARCGAGRSAQTPSSKLRRASAIARFTSVRGVAETSVTMVSSAGFSTGEGFVALYPPTGHVRAPFREDLTGRHASPSTLPR